MNIVNLVQGTQEWLAHRANFFNASDAPAMMDVSPYKTRSDLLKEMFSGVATEVSSAQQDLYNEGHRCEALYRPVAEQIVGDELYPVVGTEGKLSASFDGMTMSEETAYEHKLLNNDLRKAFDDIETVAPEHRDAQAGRLLPMLYQVQMEQQCMIGKCKRVLFAASRWSRSGEMEEERHCWYYPNPELAAKILAGWAQFQKDLDAYTPVEIVEKPKADAIMALPALAVHIRGEVIASNLPAFKAAAEKFIDSIKMDLETDEDFVNGDATVKFCDAKEKEISIAMDAAIAQMSSIDELMRTGNYVKDQLRTKRLALSKQIETRKAQIKETAVAERRQKYADHVAALNSELGEVSIAVTAPDFLGAIKGLKTIASLYDKLDTALANGKIAADAAAKDLRAKLDWYKPHAEHAFLFRDMQTLIQKPAEDFQLAVTARITEHKRQEDEKEAKRKADEAAKEAEALQPQPQPQPAAIIPVAAATIAPSPIVQGVATDRTAPTGIPTLRLGQINERLAPITLTAEGLSTLGFKHAATDKAAKLYHESDFELICAALTRHIDAALHKQAA